MDSDNESQNLSEEVVSFLTSANHFCELVSDPFKFQRSELFKYLQEILPELYSRALRLPKLEPVLNEANEKFVMEEEYEKIKNDLAQKIGYLDDYLEIIEPDFSDADGPVPTCLSEDLADIYQDLKDLLSLIHIGNNEMMNDAIWECRMNFEKYWGQKLVNGLRVIHRALNSNEPIENEEVGSGEKKSPEHPDTSNWFITKRQKEYRNNNNTDD